jgi:Subtilase family
MPNDRKEIQIKAHDDQIIVDLDDLAGIQQVLDSSHISWERIEKSTRLGLALIRLGHRPNIPAGYKDREAHSGLDLLISYLKKSYRKKHGGRTPLIGKNRLAGSVEGSPYTGGGISSPYTGGLKPGTYAGSGISGPYTGGGISGPYTGGGISGPYTGGGRSGPYTGGGASGPYTGGDLSDSQWDDSRAGFPERNNPPSPQVKVGILDTRLFAHPDLAGRYFADHDALVPATTASTPDSEAHATFIAGIILAESPNADLIVGHVLNAYNICGSSWDVATKMAAFVDAGVSVLNISFGAATHDDKPPLVLRRAVNKLTSRHVVIVAAAGNHGPNETKMWPAAFKKVVAVGAGTRIAGTDSFKVADFSPRRRWVDLLAPGEDISSLYKANGYRRWSGTSFSAAVVSGAVAYLVETQRMTPRQAVDLLRTRPTSKARRKVAGSASIEDIGPPR